MKFERPLTAVIERGEKLFVSMCPELGVASQGQTPDEARLNLAEAVELFLETADASEIENRLRKEVTVSPLEVSVA